MQRRGGGPSPRFARIAAAGEGPTTPSPASGSGGSTRGRGSDARSPGVPRVATRSGSTEPRARSGSPAGPGRSVPRLARARAPAGWPSPTARGGITRGPRFSRGRARPPRSPASRLGTSSRGGLRARSPGSSRESGRGRARDSDARAHGRDSRSASIRSSAGDGGRPGTAPRGPAGDAPPNPGPLPPGRGRGARARNCRGASRGIRGSWAIGSAGSPSRFAAPPGRCSR